MASQVNHLVEMANQIALNLGEHRNLAAASDRTAEHLQKFWTRQMREQLCSYIKSGGGDVSPAVKAALVDEAGVLREPS